MSRRAGSGRSTDASGPTGPVQPADRLRAEGLTALTWSNGPNDRYSAHDHAYDKIIVVVSGSIAFGLPDESETVQLEIGDRLELPAGTRHQAAVGPEGVSCLEAHQPAGSLGGRARRPAGSW
jgi:quercetin dioxygenase-like cupin family protein